MNTLNLKSKHTDAVFSVTAEEANENTIFIVFLEILFKNYTINIHMKMGDFLPDRITKNLS